MSNFDPADRSQRVSPRQATPAFVCCLALLVGLLVCRPAGLCAQDATPPPTKTTPRLGSGADVDGQRNVAAEARLPSGPGLASRYPGDSGLDQDSAVILFEDFSRDDYQTRWAEVRDPEGAVLQRVPLPLEGLPEDNAALQVTATLSQNTGGGLTQWFPSNDVVYIRFYVRFDKNCDYLHHFCTLRANKAVRGRDAWSGFGGAGVRPQGDERFSTAIEPFGDWGRLRPPGKWNFYSYWHQMEASPDGKYWGNAFRPAEQPLIDTDRWICVEMMLKHNTPGKADGQQAFWIDGQLLGHWAEIPWRTSPDLWANAFTLESYVTDRWTKQEQNIVWFDQVVIAKEYIGPIGPIGP